MSSGKQKHISAEKKAVPKSVQPKLKVSAPGDSFEREADAMAEKVMRYQNSGVIARSLTNKKNSAQDDSDATLRRQSMTGQGVAASPGLVSQICATRQAGQDIPGDTLGIMQNAFGRDFSDVKIHTDERSATMNRDLRARAFAVGHDIYFNQDQFSPNTPEGRRLLAHELTHVVQQDENTTSPDISRSVELHPPGPHDASAFDRVQELVVKLNDQSPAIQYSLDGFKLGYNIIDEPNMSIFDLQMRSYLDMTKMVPFRLVSGADRVQVAPRKLGRLTFDQFITGVVDLEDLLSTDNLGFQSIMVHILAERFGSPNYAKRVGGKFSLKEVTRTHEMGHQAQAFHFQGVFHDPSIEYIYSEKKSSNNFHVVFRSREKGYEVFFVVSDTDRDVSKAEVLIRTARREWLSANEFLGTQQKPDIDKTTEVHPFQANPIKLSEAEHVAGKLETIEGIHGEVMRQRKSSDQGPAPDHGWTKTLTTSGNGVPLPEDARVFMEHAFDSDLSDVRIHVGSVADALSDGINARAFTFRKAIYFGNGEFNPNSDTGKRLLAHELSHVLQQRGERVPIDLVMRAKKKDEEIDEEPKPVFENKVGKIDTTKKSINITQLEYVEEKFNRLAKALRTGRILNRVERPNNQRDDWRKALKEDRAGITKLRQELMKKGRKVEYGDGSNKENFYFFRVKKTERVFILGNDTDIVEQLIVPNWMPKGGLSNYQVDHILEWQIAEGYKQAHSLENFWLWESRANQSSGSNLKNKIKGGIRNIISEAVKAKQAWKIPKSKNREKFIGEQFSTITAKNSPYTITFDALVPGMKIKGREKDHYDKSDIMAFKSLEGLTKMTEEEVNSIRGNKNTLSIMIGNTIKGQPLKISNKFEGSRNTWIKGFTITKVLDYNARAKHGEKYASLQGELFEAATKKKLMGKQTILDIPVYKIGDENPDSGGLLYFGRIKNDFRQYVVERFSLRAASPVELKDAYFNAFSDSGSPGILIEGTVKPSISLLRNLEFDITFDGDDLRVSKTFDLTDLAGKLPKPFSISNADITISASLLKGFTVSGDVEFGIEKLGQGSVHGDNGNGFLLVGEFNFEKGLFDRSGVTVSYEKERGSEEGKFTFKGFAEKSGDKTLKHARIDVSYENNVLTARGEAETRLPGISKGIIEVITGNDTTSIIADFTLNDSIPGLKGGNVHFLFLKTPDDKYRIDANAQVQTKFPGIPQVSVNGTYNSDGVFTFEGAAPLHLGRFNGNIHFGITNRELDPNGNLTDKKGDKLIAYGDGDIDFKITDWLHADVGAKITPDGKIILNGKLIPDQHLAITKSRDPLHKDFGEFNLPKFTLFGIPHIADIYVSASGGFFLEAGIGPLFLDDAFLSVEQLDIEAPENAVIKGGGKLDLPAFAQLGVQLTIKAGVDIAVVDVHIDLKGSLAFGITGNAGFALAFSWSVGTGLKLEEAMATLKAQTELIAKIGGALNVDIDFFIGHVNLYRRPFDIGEKRWPLGLDLDVKFPFAFEGGDAGNFKVPDVHSIKHDDPPKFDKETVKSGAMGEPPEVSAAPGKEKVIARLRVLTANAVASSWVQRLIERYSYADALKTKYPDLNWDYADTELKSLDEKEFNQLKDKLLYHPDLPRSEFGRKLRLGALFNFEEEHRYINYTAAAELRKKVEEMQNED